MKAVLFTNKGLTDVSVKELNDLSLEAMEIIEESDKRIIIDLNNLEGLKNLRTINDAGLLVFEKEEEYLDNDFILSQVKSLDILNSIEYLKKIRNIKGDSISLTFSIFKNTNLNKDILYEKLRNIFKTKFNLELKKENESDLNLRVSVDENRLLMSYRIFKNPLYKRSSLKQNYLGSLNPTIAAALVKIALSKASDAKTIVDNFCGSGTILSEASELGLDVYGGDKNERGVEITKSRLGKKFMDNIKVQDAQNTKFPNSYFDLAVSNYPYDKQVKLTNSAKLYDQSLKEYRRILKRESVVVFLLKNRGVFLKYFKNHFSDHKFEFHKLGFKGQTPWLFIAWNNS